MEKTHTSFGDRTGKFSRLDRFLLSRTQVLHTQFGYRPAPQRQGKDRLLFRSVRIPDQNEPFLLRSPRRVKHLRHASRNFLRLPGNEQFLVRPKRGKSTCVRVEIKRRVKSVKQQYVIPPAPFRKLSRTMNSNFSGSNSPQHPAESHGMSREFPKSA